MIRLLTFIGILVAVVAGIVFGAAFKAEAAGPLFRIIEVRAEYGHLVVEAQHFKPNGSHWFYENYTFQGREAYKHPRVTDASGRLFLKAHGREAPKTVSADGVDTYYLPEGTEWMRYSRPHLAADSVLGVIQAIHEQRRRTGWTRGQYRLTTHPLDYTPSDALGANTLRQRLAGIKDTAYQRGPDGGLLAYQRPVAPVDHYVSTAWGTVSTFYPDGDTETTSVDGDANRKNQTRENWATIRAGAGTQNNDSLSTTRVLISTDNPTPDWGDFERVFLLFDTSSLGDSDIIDSATMEVVATASADDFTDSISMITTTPASDTTLKNADYSQQGTTKQATDIAISAFTVDSSTYNAFTLNTTGEGNISLTGITKFGLRSTADTDNSEPTWSGPFDSSSVTLATAEEVLSGDKRPRLVVTHTTPSAAITGTAGDGATEQEVRDGGQTVIITITDATWVAAGGTFDAQRQAIIDGLDAAEAETNGWNAQVRDQLGVASVVRTSSTVVTITISASDVGNYRVDSNETITVTVPASAISIGSAITGTPTALMTASAESMAVTGTLGGSGGTPAELVAGGETIIETLTNTVWVASGATFDAQRQNIIDNLDSNLSDQNGWDARRADFAVTDVARTSDTIVTITLAASSAYAIPLTETISATAPASALVYGAALAGAPTFNVTPSFEASGTRVSTAIDLSSVTDVAYCAIGWESDTPTNTTATVDTSVNGGTDYSSATNGNCPTGISVGASLATITDFRIRVTLTTSDATVSPFVTALALVIEDDSGQDLYYQLNTTPGVTLTDRSANTNVGTLSFPTGVTGVASTLGDLQSTRAVVTTEQALVAPQVTSPVSGSANAGNLFEESEEGWAGLPFYGIVNAMANAGDGMPISFFWALFIGMLTIGLGFMAIQFTQSLLIAAIAMGGGLAFGGLIGNGLIPLWVLFAYIPMAGALIMLRPKMIP